MKVVNRIAITWFGIHVYLSDTLLEVNVTV